MNEVFLDASYAIALASTKDTHHRRALELAQQLEASQNRLITTQPVVFEIGNALSRLSHRRAATLLIDSIEQDPVTEVLPCSGDLYRRALELFRSREDKEWGLTDCLSFVVMEDRGLTEALTADHHYQQTGYRALILETS